MVALPSLLDNDFYKFTMQQCVVKLFPRAGARYRFINRGGHRFPPGFAEALRASVDALGTLKLRLDEKHWLAAACPYLDPVYLDFLQGYCYDPSEVQIRQEGGDVEVTVEGYWYRTILWEVPLLCLIAENYYALLGTPREPDETVQAKARRKIEDYGALGVSIAEFGTRRRHSYAVQDAVVATLKKYGSTFVGTSNVHLAHRHGLKPIGTHAHEWFMYHAAQYGYKMANTMALEHWVEVYRGELGIALTDTFTTGEFFEVFDRKFARLFDGLRHDSGDPLLFADRSIAHYQSLGIDPLSKTIIFSDGLNEAKVRRIAAHCRGRVGFSFGIGTNFSNDVGLEPVNIVLKLTEARPAGSGWTPVIKLSDVPGKHSGDERQIRLAEEILGIRQ